MWTLIGVSLFIVGSYLIREGIVQAKKDFSNYGLWLILIEYLRNSNNTFFGALILIVGLLFIFTGLGIF